MKRKKFLSTFLVVVLAMSMSLSVFAAEPTNSFATEQILAESSETTDQAVSEQSARSVYGYAADYTDNEADYFYVNATGSYALAGGVTLKSSDFSSSTQIIYVNVYRPDGTLAISNVKLTGNEEKKITFTNAKVGNYKVVYNVGGIHKGWIHCWVY